MKMGQKRTTKIIIKKKKRVTVSSMKRKVWDVFSKYIRTRDCLRTTGCKDWGLCITCDKRYHFKLLQAGHFIAGRHNAGLFAEKGVHAQCYNCNINLKGNTLEYRRRIVKLYGEEADVELEEEAHQTKSFTVDELQSLLEHYQKEVKASLESKLGDV